MSVKAKIIGSFGALVALIICLVTAVSDYNFRKSSEEKVLDTLQLEVSLFSRSIENKLQTYYSGLRLISDTLAVDESGMPNTFQLAEQLQETEKNLNMFGAAYAHSSGVTYKPKGIIPKFNAKKLQREWFVRSMADDKNVATLPYVNNEGDLVMSLSVPVKRGGKVVGVLNANISVGELSQFIDDGSRNSQLYVSRPDGYILASGNADEVGKNLFEKKPTYQSYAEQESSSHTYTSEGDEYYVTNFKLPKMGWSVWAWEKWRVINADASSNLAKSAGLAVVLIILALIVIYYLVIKLMYVPIGGEPSDIESLVKSVSQGKLKIDAKTDAATGIFSSIAKMASVLSNSVKEINSAAQELSISAQDSADSASNMTNSSHEQMEQLEQAAVAMNQMSLSVDEVARNALLASTTADETFQHSEQGKQLVSNVNSNLADLVQGIEQVSSVLQELENESQSIEKILDVISEISEQTNLLALNAAIEAARAGESGRGFAVVADEVRNLAGRTQESTNMIQDMISKLQDRAKHSVTLIDENVKKTYTTSESSESADQALTSIQESVAAIKDMNAQIATASEEQTHVSSEINEKISGINDVAKVNFERSQGNSEKAEELNAISDSIKKSIGFFEY